MSSFINNQNDNQQIHKFDDDKENIQRTQSDENLNHTQVLVGGTEQFGKKQLSQIVKKQILYGNNVRHGSWWSKIAPYLGLLMATLAFSGQHVYAQPCLIFIPPQALAFFRVSLATLPLGLTAYFSEGKPTYSKKAHFVHFIMGFFGVACNTYLAFIGIKLAGPDIYSVIQPSIPIYVSFYSMTLKIEKFSWWKIVGLAFTISGCLILVQIDHMKFGNQVVQGTIIIILQSLSYSIYLVIMDWHLKSYPYPYTAFSRATFWGWICICVVCAVDFPQISWTSVPWWVWVGVLYGGIVVSFVAHSTVAWAVGKVQAVIPAVSLCLQPMFTTTLAWLFLGDILSFRDVLAMIVIIIGLLVVVWAKLREQMYVEKNLLSSSNVVQQNGQQTDYDDNESYNEKLLSQVDDFNLTRNEIQNQL